MTDAGIHTMVTADSAAGRPHDDVGVGILCAINPTVRNGQAAQHPADVVGLTGHLVGDGDVAVNRTGVGHRVAAIAAVAFLYLGREDALNPLATIGIGRGNSAEGKLTANTFSRQRVSPVKAGMTYLRCIGIDGTRVAVSGACKSLDFDAIVTAINSAWVCIGVSAEVFLVRAVKGRGTIGFKQGIQGIIIA